MGVEPLGVEPLGGNSFGADPLEDDPLCLDILDCVLASPLILSCSAKIGGSLPINAGMRGAGDQDFSVLAVLSDRHAIGKKRWTRGVMGAEHASQVAAPLREAQAEMAVG